MFFGFKIIFIFIGLKAAWALEINPLGGLIVGLIFGQMLDYIATARFQQWRSQKYYTKQAKVQFEEQFITSMFLMFGQICSADGAITKAEIAFIENIMSERLKLDKRSRNHAIEVFRSARNSRTSFQSSAVRFYELHQNYPHVFALTIQMFFDVATADGALSVEEEKLIRTAATVFSIEEAQYQQLLSHYSNINTESRRQTNQQSSYNRSNNIPPSPQSQLKRAYATLGCEQRDPDSEIKKRYRKLASEYHPDKIMAKDLPQEFIDFANHKFKDIQSAYETIKAERGFS